MSNTLIRKSARADHTNWINSMLVGGNWDAVENSGRSLKRSMLEHAILTITLFANIMPTATDALGADLSVDL
eukprot:4175432-Pyramimonas_sp.AAC.1